MRKLIIALSVLCTALVALCAILAFLLYGKPRFITSNSSNPYIMFDTKTAQACWSGPSNNGTVASNERGKDPFLAAIGAPDSSDPFAAFKALNATANSAGIPFCKSLK
jgi:hypothetical protein